MGRKPLTMTKSKFTDEQLVASYKMTQSVWKTAKEFGLCGQSVHERLKKLGVTNPPNGISDEQRQMIVEAYAKPFNRGESPLPKLEQVLGMHRSNICRIARRLGLTIRGRKLNQDQKNKAKVRMVEWHESHDHPRGMLGKKHSQQACDQMSASRMGRRVKPETVDKIMRTRFQRYGTLATNTRMTASWKCGWREIGGVRIYARSRWEANYGRYLEWLRANGSIAKWEHEPETFWFEKIKRGCRSYLPDFRITENDGSVVYHEVKGWFDARSKTKIKRMAKYHPKVVLRIIDASWFKANGRKLSQLIHGWET